MYEQTTDAGAPAELAAPTVQTPVPGTAPFVEPTPSAPVDLDRPAGDAATIDPNGGGAAGVDPAAADPAPDPALDPAPDPARDPGIESKSPDTEPGGDGAEVEEVEASSLSEVLQQLEIDQDWFKQLKVSVKVNGAVSEVPLGEVMDSFEIQQAARQRLDEAKVKSEAAKAEIAARGELLAKQTAIVGKLFEQAEEALKQEVDQTDWAKLREEDSGEYAARRDEIKERRGALEDLKRQAASDYDKLVADQRAEAVKTLTTEIIPQQQAALAKAIPEWADPATAKAEQTALVRYLAGSYGYDPAELVLDPKRPLEQPGVLDHRLIVLARKAMLYDQGRDKASVRKKRVIKVQKVLQPGPAADAPAPAADVDFDDDVAVLYPKKGQ